MVCHFPSNLLDIRGIGGLRFAFTLHLHPIFASSSAVAFLIYPLHSAVSGRTVEDSSSPEFFKNGVSPEGIRLR